MEKQSEAERLSEALEQALKQTDADDDVIHVARWFVEDSAAELRRLHAVNAQLLEALKLMRDRFLDFDGSHGSWEQEATDAADAAIAAASDETSNET